MLRTLFLVAVIIRLFFLFSTDNYFAGDATARLYFSYAWSQTHSLMPVSIWLPLQFYILGTCIQLTGDVLYAPRLITIFLASLSIIPFYYISQSLFNSRTAYIAVILFALFPSHILSSIITLNDALFIFFLLYAIWWFMCWRINPTNISGLILILFLNGASLIRFEGWIYATLISFFVIITVTEFRKKIFPFVGCFIAPIIMMGYAYHNTGDFLDGLHHSDLEVSNYFRLSCNSPLTSISFISMGFAHCIWLFALLFITTQKMNNKTRMYLVIVLPALLLMLYKVVTGTLIGEMRYFVTPAILLIPVGASFIERSRIKVFWLGVATICIGITYLQIFYWQKGMLPAKFAKGFFESCSYTERYLNPKNCRLFMDQTNWQGHAWAAYSNNIYRGNSETQHGIYAYISGKYWMGEVFQISEFVTELKAKKITHVVLFRDGELSTKLKALGCNNDWQLLKKNLVFNNNGYSIYSIQSNN